MKPIPYAIAIGRIANHLQGNDSAIKDIADLIRFGVEAGWPGMEPVAGLRGAEPSSNQMATASSSEPFNGITIKIADGIGVEVPFKDKFKFGKGSIRELVGVKDELQALAHLALRLTDQDFTVYDGLRTIEEQRGYVKAGTSKTMQSKHLPQADGKSHAIDLVPWSGGRPVWDWNLIYPIVLAVTCAAIHLGIARKVRWGGAWDRVLADFIEAIQDPTEFAYEVEAYCKRHEGKDFIDGPHFEWVG